MLVDGGLRFYEAKIAETGARISQNLATQRESLPLVDQIRRSANSIRLSRKTIIASYRKVFSNLAELCGVRDRHPERHKLLKVKLDELPIDCCPWLAVTRTKEITNKNWYKHLDKPKCKLNDGVICIDSPSEFKSRAD